MNSHLSLAQSLWRKLLKPSDRVIDATCGNGKDTRTLAEMVPDGHVYALDIQETALERARIYCGCPTPADSHFQGSRSINASFSNISFLLQSHEQLPDVPQLKLVIYNLGYLPGGDKSITTRCETTLASIQLAMEKIIEGGAISIMCYPGHAEGAKEQKNLLQMMENLDPASWEYTHHYWSEQAPSLMFLTKKFSLHT